MDISPSKVLTLGIVALATCGIGIPGIVLGALARKNGRLYVAAHGATTGQVKAGSIMGMVGLISGIVMTVFWVIYIIAIGALIGSAF